MVLSKPHISELVFLDPTARAARKIFDHATEIEREAYADIARARFALQGRAAYPDGAS